MKWQELERLVRTVAEAKFDAVARAEDIAGVKCDCVLRLNDGSVVLVEISKESDISKLRIDLAKFNVLRPHFFGQNIFPKCFFVTLENPTPALIAAGKENFVQVYSVVQFFDALLGLHRYAKLRREAAFGSAIDIYSGRPDQTKYVPVNYISNNGEGYSTERIAAELVNGRTVVLIGDYGSGKSRCVKEVFEQLLRSQQSHYRNPVAINLRENWGLKRSQEILTRHFTDIGLQDVVGQALKVAFSPATIYLLDGFDEIGAQTWSDDPTKLVSIRRQSLVGVKDLITKTKGGILITGREHYFNNDAELVTCLGLDRKNPLFLRCNQELNEAQFADMIGRVSPTLPAWMPKKPLIAAIIRDIDAATIDNLFSSTVGEFDFWNLLIDTFCEREATINPILDSQIIRSLYARIGRLTRSTSTPLGPISIKQINDAFEDVTGRPPTDESAIVLQRIPGLSRIGAESLDRQFADTYILDGLKAEDILDLLAHGSPACLADAWRNPIEEFGSAFVGARLQSTKQTFPAVAFLKRHRQAKNKILLSDVLSALFKVSESDISMGDYELEGGKFFKVSLADAALSDLRLSYCQFEYLDITDASPNNVILEDCIILRLAGLASSDHCPDWLKGPVVEEYQSVTTLAAIRQAGLSVAQTFLLSSLRKLFLQPGGGRKESSMYKGYGDSNTKRSCEKVIQLLVREEFCSRFRGESEDIFVPNRSLTARVQAIMNQLTTSKDPVWLQVSRIS